MQGPELDFTIERMGDCRVPSPLSGPFADNASHILFHSNLQELEPFLKAGRQPPAFELAGPRERIFFDPSQLKCGIVTCGGLCPGLNDVIRAIVLALFHQYGVARVFGFRYGYEGLSAKHRHRAMELTPDVVKDIHQDGGTMLGSSRGPQDASEMVDTLQRMGVGLLFAIGGDGTLRGAQAIAAEIRRRGLEIGVVGIPKTIDNDISFVDMSFGFETAVSEARDAIYSAHTEAIGARNGIGLVKLMGRESGFIAAYTSIAHSDVNFCLVPEVPFQLEAFLQALQRRLEARGHAVVVVGEGAGQDLLQATGEKDASGNLRFQDIGLFLKQQIDDYLTRAGMDFSLKYIDPSYTIRSMPANPRDSAFCLILGHSAVHAGMAGRTNMVVGYWRTEFTHVPIHMAVSRRKRIDPNGKLWPMVLACTGQPRDM